METATAAAAAAAVLLPERFKSICNYLADKSVVKCDLQIKAAGEAKLAEIS